MIYMFAVSPMNDYGGNLALSVNSHCALARDIIIRVSFLGQWYHNKLPDFRRLCQWGLWTCSKGRGSLKHTVNEPAPTQEEQEACQSYAGPDIVQKKPRLNAEYPSSVAHSPALFRVFVFCNSL